MDLVYCCGEDLIPGPGTFTCYGHRPPPPKKYTHTHTHPYIKYICIYIYTYTYTFIYIIRNQLLPVLENRNEPSKKVLDFLSINYSLCISSLYYSVALFLMIQTLFKADFKKKKKMTWNLFFYHRITPFLLATC